MNHRYRVAIRLINLYYYYLIITDSNVGHDLPPAVINTRSWLRNTQALMC